MQRDARAFLWDVLHAANKIERFLQGQTRDSFIKDELLQSAVERQLAIIGEALRQLSRTAPAVAQEVGDVEQIIGLRNVLIHGYAIVDSDLIWRSVQEDLPTLEEDRRAAVGQGLTLDEPRGGRARVGSRSGRRRGVPDRVAYS